ncbi:alpha/beta fold hydrolase [Tannockella kyphosi]|uniref:alpha/beta fold hydrolase n=1 Tax=Tannockella kyphosi TaxID=2899121 RepID=UPI0020139A7F|nr:alpha/beta fold hydrolase [Tannockella kyphosi]
MKKKEGLFDSSCVGQKIQYYIYEPKQTPIAIIQLSHGMCEYVERYEEFALDCCNKGIIFCGHDHLGHGNTGKYNNSFGYFSPKDGDQYVVEDLHIFTTIMKEKYPGIPCFLFGHSMGSFIARSYLSKYEKDIQGCIICGTAGKNPLSGIGCILCKALGMVKGGRNSSKLINNMALGAYNKGFKKETGVEWLSRDEQICQKYIRDPYCTFSFSIHAYRDLFKLLTTVNEDSWYTSFAVEFPVFLVAGDKDPVGENGKGVREVYDHLIQTGHKNVELKLYQDARHELLNEINKEEVSNDFMEWVLKYCS